MYYYRFSHICNLFTAHRLCMYTQHDFVPVCYCIGCLPKKKKSLSFNAYIIWIYAHVVMVTYRWNYKFDDGKVFWVSIRLKKKYHVGVFTSSFLLIKYKITICSFFDHLLHLLLVNQLRIFFSFNNALYRKIRGVYVF